MSSAICFNLDQSTILSSGNGLNSLIMVSWSNRRGRQKHITYVHLIAPNTACFAPGDVGVVGLIMNSEVIYELFINPCTVELKLTEDYTNRFQLVK